MSITSPSNDDRMQTIRAITAAVKAKRLPSIKKTSFKTYDNSEVIKIDDRHHFPSWVATAAGLPHRQDKNPLSSSSSSS